MVYYIHENAALKSFLCSLKSAIVRTIGLEGLRFHAMIGFYPEERILGNEIEISVYVTMDLNEDIADDVNQTLDYDKIYEQVKNVLTQPINLLETAVSKILRTVVLLSDDIIMVRVRVAKLHPPITGSVKKIFVEEQWVRDEGK